MAQAAKKKRTVRSALEIVTAKVRGMSPSDLTRFASSLTESDLESAAYLRDKLTAALEASGSILASPPEPKG